MALIYCPECGQEVSNSAVACPSCGRPLHSVPVVKEVVPVREEREIPKWVIIPVAIVLGLVLVLAFVLLYRSGEDDANVNLKVNASRPATSREVGRTDTVVESAPSSVTTVPGSSTSVNPPATSVYPPSTTTVPGSGTQVAPPTKGSVTVDAKIANRNGTAPVRNARFYLLDKDVEAILSEANVEPIEGQTMMSSLGLAAAFPGRYGDFQKRAMAAIRAHVKHSATSNGSGKAEFSDVDPDLYYLFAVTNTPQGFAIWSSSVTIAPGANVLNLSPQPVTDVSSFSD